MASWQKARASAGFIGDDSLSAPGTGSDRRVSVRPLARVGENGLLALFLTLPLAAHVLFSGLGFAPTDQGFILAGAWRLLEGQVPHRDFITVRPAGSLALHAPLVALGGPYALWLSRGVAWLELAGTAWIWTTLFFGQGTAPVLRLALAAAAAMLSAHTFPLMAWHTIDALFLASAGIALAFGARGGTVRRLSGWLLLGLTPLCRQNFLFVPLGALVLTRQWRHPSAWGAVALPGLAYVTFLAATGGLGDAWMQLRTHGADEAWRAGFVRYATLPGTWIGLGAGLAGAVASRRTVASGFARAFASAVAFGVVAFAAADLVPGGRPFPWAGAFVLFGAALAVVAARAASEGGSESVRRALLACLLAWTVSLSIGYNSPALAAGPLALVIVALGVSRRMSVDLAAPAAVLAFAVAAAFTVGRLEDIYRERPARELTFDVGEHVAAGRLLRTNPRTGLFLEELDRLAADARKRGKRIAVLPDFPAWWVGNPQPNPLPVDWALDVELARPELVERTVEAVHHARGTIVVLVQKYESHSAPRGFAPLSPTRYEVVNAVRRDLAKTGETLLFERYE